MAKRLRRAASRATFGQQQAATRRLYLRLKRVIKGALG